MPLTLGDASNNMCDTFDNWKVSVVDLMKSLCTSTKL
jgi:hypothetical protein